MKNDTRGLGFKKEDPVFVEEVKQDISAIPFNVFQGVSITYRIGLEAKVIKVTQGRKKGFIAIQNDCHDARTVDVIVAEQPGNKAWLSQLHTKPQVLDWISSTYSGQSPWFLNLTKY